MDTDEEDMEYLMGMAMQHRDLMVTNNEHLSEIIIGAALNVLNKLRPGPDEKLYERALVIECSKQGLICDQQKQWLVFCHEHILFRHAKLHIKLISN
jgi:hypothetical protein